LPIPHLKPKKDQLCGIFQSNDDENTKAAKYLNTKRKVVNFEKAVYRTLRYHFEEYFVIQPTQVSMGGGGR
jgi:hypothetical protein